MSTTQLSVTSFLLNQQHFVIGQLLLKKVITEYLKKKQKKQSAITDFTLQDNVLKAEINWGLRPCYNHFFYHSLT